MIELGAGRELGRAEQPRDRQRAAGIRKPRADLVGLVPQIARQKAGQKRIPGAEHVVNLDVQSRRDQPVLESVGNAIRKHDATPWAALAHDDRTRQRADPANGAERLLDPGRDVQLLLGPDDELHVAAGIEETLGDRKSTRLNSSHVAISYAVSCLKKKTPLTKKRRRGRDDDR